MPNRPQSPQANRRLEPVAEAPAVTRTGRAKSTRKKAQTLRVGAASAPADMTLLELVQLLGSFLEDDRDVAETARRLLRRGEVRLVGNFRGEPIECFETNA